MELLARLGGPDHRALLDACQRGGARPWIPLSSSVGPSTLFLEVAGRCDEGCIVGDSDPTPQVGDALNIDTCVRVVREGAALGFKRLELIGADPFQDLDQAQDCSRPR